MNQQAIDILKAMKRKAEIKRWTGCGYMIETIDEAIHKIEALGDGGGIFIVPGKTYYIGDNGIPAVALHPRFQYSNGTIDTIHHTNISELPPNK